MEEIEKKRTIRDEMKMDDTMKWFRDGSLSVCGLRKETKEVLLNRDSLQAGVTQKKSNKKTRRKYSRTNK